jgi:Uma2 family endonuclease
MIVEVPLVVTDEDVTRVGRRNPGWRVERIAGDLVMTPPSGYKGDGRALRAARLILDWADGNGGFVSGSQSGVKPPNGDLLAPDVSWVAAERWNRLTPEEQEGFLPLAPDVVVEVLSESDEIKRATKKCERWFETGVAYVVLIDPYRKTIATWGEAPAADFPDFTPILEM